LPNAYCLFGTHSARVETENKKNFSEERLRLLTCLLMGDPGWRAAPFVPLEEDPDFEVGGEVLKEFIVLVKNFLMNGKAAHHDRLADSSAR
jgi:hypothetical protein